jgi:hypothetical protein
MFTMTASGLGALLVAALGLLVFFTVLYLVVRAAVRDALGSQARGTATESSAEPSGARRARELHRRAVDAEKYPDT